MNSNTNKTLFFINGMHRSGTSSVASLFVNLGGEIGKSVMPAASDNPYGFFENWRLVEYHDKILQKFRVSWDRPHKISWDTVPENKVQRYVDELSNLVVEEFLTDKPLIIKDPRMVMLMPLWEKVADQLQLTAKHIDVVRNPEDITRSLLLRNGMEPQWGMYLCQSYMDMLFRRKDRGDKSYLIFFENLLRDPVPIENELALFFGASAENLTEPKNNLNSALVHKRSSAKRHSKIGELYDTLMSDERLSEFPGHILDDKSRDLFKVAEQAFHSEMNLMETYRLTSANLSYQKLLNEQQNQKLTALDQELANLHRDFDSVQQSLENLLQSGKQEQDLLEHKIDHAEKRAFKTELYQQKSNIKFRRKIKDIEAESGKFYYRSMAISIFKRVADIKNGLFSSSTTANDKVKTDRNLAVRIRGKLVRLIKVSVRTIIKLLPISASMKNKITAKLRHILVRRRQQFLGQPILTQIPEINRPKTAQEIKVRAQNISFAKTTTPDISIIIPVYNQLDYTICCLESLIEQADKYSFEVIVMDDLSSDATESIVSEIPGVRYCRNDVNLGFVRNCNAGAQLAKGEYLVFLNNDTVVRENWLTTLRNTFDQNENVGIAGSKLIYANGELQEAGGIIWEDASGWNVGRLLSPDHPSYNYLRDVDYVSGASLMISKDLFEKLDRFDISFTPAYYEDASLCFEARNAGYRVVYQPLSEVIHFEGITSGTDLTSGVKKHQVINQGRFKEIWSTVLENHLANGTTPHIARDRLVKGHILFIDAETPTPDKDAGSLNVINMMSALSELGYRIHFIPQDNFAKFGHYTKDMQKLGINCIYYPHFNDVQDYLQKTDEVFDFVFLTRVSVATDEFQTVKKVLPHVPIIFYTVDLHFLRETREAELLGSSKLHKKALETKNKELQIVAESNRTIVLSEKELEILQSVEGYENIDVLPLIHKHAMRNFPGFEQRSGVGFIGGYNHAPNVSAVEFLIDQIWPKVLELCQKNGKPPIPLLIGGSNMPEKIAEKIHRSSFAQNLGFIEDLNLFFDGCRMTVAPLKVGAGLKGKVTESWSNCVPVVGTEIAFEGLPHHSILDEITLVSNDSEILAQLVFDTYDNKELWVNISQNAREYSELAFGFSGSKNKIAKILERAKNS